MLSSPGKKAHARAMAIDVHPRDRDSNLVNMGTAFDEMCDKSDRTYLNFPEDILQNRQILETAFRESAKTLNLPMLPLPNEWWDFRFPGSYADQFSPLHDKDLPPQMQMTTRTNNNIPDFGQEHFDKLAEDILYRVNEAI